MGAGVFVFKGDPAVKSLFLKNFRYSGNAPGFPPLPTGLILLFFILINGGHKFFAGCPLPFVLKTAAPVF